MSYSNPRQMWSSAPVDINSFVAGTTMFASIEKAAVHKVGVRVQGTDAGGASAVTFARRRGASTDVTIATLVIPASNQQGNLIYKELSPAVELLPGDLVIMTITEGVAALVCTFVVEYSLTDADLPSGTAVLSA